MLVSTELLYASLMYLPLTSRGVRVQFVVLLRLSPNQKEHRMRQFFAPVSSDVRIESLPLPDTNAVRYRTHWQWRFYSGVTLDQTSPVQCLSKFNHSLSVEHALPGIHLHSSRKHLPARPASCLCRALPMAYLSGSFHRTPLFMAAGFHQHSARSRPVQSTLTPDDVVGKRRRARHTSTVIRAMRRRRRDCH